MHFVMFSISTSEDVQRVHAIIESGLHFIAVKCCIASQLCQPCCSITLCTYPLCWAVHHTVAISFALCGHANTCIHQRLLGLFCNFSHRFAFGQECITYVMQLRRISTPTLTAVGSYHYPIFALQQLAMIVLLKLGISVARTKISVAIMVQGSLIGRAKAEAASQRPSRCTVQAETDCGQAKLPCTSQTSSASAQGGPETKANIKVHHLKDKHR